MTGGGTYAWSPPSEFEEDDVLAAEILSSRFERFPILSVHGDGMLACGMSFSLFHVGFLSRQALCYFDGWRETNCAIRLPVFYTRGDIEAIVVEAFESCYDYDSPPFRYSSNDFVSEEKLSTWRDRICGPEKDTDRWRPKGRLAC